MQRLNHTAIGEAIVHFHQLEKQGADTPDLSYGLTGRLYLSQSGWLMLSVPNALGRGAFQALNVPGAELPLQDSTGQYNAHISVMRPEEILKCGGPDKVLERGKEFSFTLGPVREVNPEGWDEMERAWFIQVRSPDLEKLRKSYGLTPLPNNNKYDFHITFAVRRKHVTRDNNVMMRRVGDIIHNPSKYFADKYTRKTASTGWEVKDSAIHGKGLFATKEFGPADVIASGGHFAPDGTFMRSDALKPINHSKRPNTVVRLEDDELLIVADDLITPGEELTLDYVDAYSVLGIDVQFEDGSGIESNNDVLEKKSENRWLKVIREVVEDDECADAKSEDCRPNNHPPHPRSSPRSPSKDQQAQIQRDAIEEQQSSQKLAGSDLDSYEVEAFKTEPLIGRPGADISNYLSRLQSRAKRIQQEELASSRMQAALKGDFGYSQSQDYWAGRTPQRPKLLHQLTDMAMQKRAIDPLKVWKRPPSTIADNITQTEKIKGVFGKPAPLVLQTSYPQSGYVGPPAPAFPIKPYPSEILKTYKSKPFQAKEDATYIRHFNYASQKAPGGVRALNSLGVQRNPNGQWERNLAGVASTNNPVQAENFSAALHGTNPFLHREHDPSGPVRSAAVNAYKAQAATKAPDKYVRPAVDGVLPSYNQHGYDILKARYRPHQISEIQSKMPEGVPAQALGMPKSFPGLARYNYRGLGPFDTATAYVPNVLDTNQIAPADREKFKTFVDILGSAGIKNHELEHTQQYMPTPYDFQFNKEMMNRFGWQKEVGPSIGDLVFLAEQFRRAEGKPLQHTVKLPGGTEHDINWMRDQAKQHGYFKGRPMTDLIFNTPEGQQWYAQQLERMRGNAGR